MGRSLTREAAVPITPILKIRRNGQTVDWDRAIVAAGSHPLHDVTGIFEGARAHETAKGPGLVRMTPHIERFYRLGCVRSMPMTYPVPWIVVACKDIVRFTGLSSCHVRPLEVAA